MADDPINRRYSGSFKLGQRVIVWHSAFPKSFVGPSVITEKEYRVFINAVSGESVIGWGYRTDRMPADSPWLAAGYLRPMPEPAAQYFTAQLFAELGVNQ